MIRALALLLALTAFSAAHAVSITGTRWQVSGQNVLDNNGKVLIPRGYNWNVDAQPVQDAADNRAQGANMARIVFGFYNRSNKDDCAVDAGGNPLTTQAPYTPTGQDYYSPGTVDPQTGLTANITLAGLAALDAKVNAASAAGLWVDIADFGQNCDFWISSTLITQWSQMLVDLAVRYAATSHIGGYELASEPSPLGDPNDNPLVASAFEQAITAIRAVDATTPIIVGAASAYNPRNLGGLFGVSGFAASDTKLIGVANFYELGSTKVATGYPDGEGYVKQAQFDPTCANCIAYPGTFVDTRGDQPSVTCSYANESGSFPLNYGSVGALLACVTAARTSYNIPVFIDQIGIRTVTPGALQYMTDVTTQVTAAGLGFDYWVYRLSYNVNNIPNGGDISVLWQDSGGVWHANAAWYALIGASLNAPYPGAPTIKTPARRL